MEPSEATKPNTYWERRTYIAEETLFHAIGIICAQLPATNEQMDNLIFQWNAAIEKLSNEFNSAAKEAE